MANIFLTRKCNLNCPYCFADEFVNKENEEYTLENIKKAINFIKTDKDEKIGLIGGEPSLYPYFKEVLSILNADEDIPYYIIYTNGLEIDRYIDDITNKKTQILINCNSPDDLGSRYKKLEDNIKLLIFHNFRDFMLGVNLYSSSFDYSYIFDLLKITGQHKLRFSTSLPNSEKEESIDALESFSKIKPFLFSFFEDCYRNEIVPTNDCNAIPNCLLDKEDKKFLVKLKLLSDKYKTASTIITGRTCSPVIDIFPDLTAVRCFGLAKYMKVPIADFKSLQALRMYFYNKIDLYAKLSFERKECEDCNSRIFEKCGLCYTYKIKKCNKLKNMILDNTK